MACVRMRCVVAVLLVLSLHLAAGAQERALVDLPKVDGIAIDGKGADWGERGLHVKLFTRDGKVKPAADLDIRMQAGWSDAGLLFLLTVRDDVPHEAEAPQDFWRKDSVQIFQCSGTFGRGRCDVGISPGRDPKHPEMRLTWGRDRRSREGRAHELAIEAKRTLTEDGYVLEALMPWTNLDITPKVGDEVGFMVVVNESDGHPNDRFAPRWSGPGNFRSGIRLAEKPAPPVVAAAGMAYDGFRGVDVTIAAAAELLGRTVTVREGDAVRATGTLAERGGRAGLDLRLPMPPAGKPYGEMTVSVGEHVVGAFTLPNPDAARARKVVELEPVPSAYVFTGTALPAFEFEQPLVTEELIGAYTITPTYYNAAREVVKTAEKPGRYGAVVEVRSEKAGTFRRFTTLYCHPGRIDWWDHDAKASIVLPEGLGVDPAVAAASKELAVHLKYRLAEGLKRDPYSAVVFAGLAERTPGAEVAFLREVEQIDRLWWLPLKRTLYGWDKQFPKPFVCPRPSEGDPAPTLREGTCEQAGMKPGADKRIDALLTAWAADTDEPFSVCVARNNVIVLHKAYGTLKGRPLTVDDPMWMASISKLMSGTLMLEAIDQGLVSLDDEASKYFPPLRGVTSKVPLTVRLLAVHTHGLRGNISSTLNDLAERVAAYVPYGDVGGKFVYGSLGVNLNCKILEAVSGEPLPHFFQNHLFGPLGCKHSWSGNASGAMMSTPRDVATIAQMIINGGVYDNMRFFSPETAALLPPGPKTSPAYGMGTRWMSEPGLGKGAFGHGAASSAILRIDPAQKLIIVQCRNDAGRNYGKYADKFIQTVTENLAE